MRYSTGWLIDKSAYVRVSKSIDAERWWHRTKQGLVHISPLTLAELGYSARNHSDWVDIVSGPRASEMLTESITLAVEDRALEVQGVLAVTGRHRAVSIPDLFIAATAELANLTVLHVDKDFDLIAKITGQPVERLRLPDPASNLGV